MLALFAAAAATALALAIPQGLDQRIGQDFAVFWQAGKNFASGAPLYHDYLPGARQFKYPPFAALVFTPLALFSLPVAAVLVSLLNLGLWIVAVLLTRDVVALTFQNRTASRIPLALAAVLTAQFFLDNFHHVQVNAVIFVLVLYGLRAFLHGRDLQAAASLVAATAIKITPVFFVAWLLIRGRRRSALAVFPLALAAVLVPLLLRGPATGSAELVEYYHSFLKGHQRGEIGSYTAGQNLAALVSRMTREPEDPGRVSFRYLPTTERTAQLAYRLLWAGVLSVFLVKLALLRYRRAPVSAFELAMVFLTALLLSPITFTTHLLPLLFVFTTVLSLRPSVLRGPGYVWAGIVCLGMGATGLSGRDLAGDAAYRNVAGYSLIAWTMLLLFAVVVTLAGRERQNPASLRSIKP